jgi:hypothetical protein
MITKHGATAADLCRVVEYHTYFVGQLFWFSLIWKNRPVELVGKRIDTRSS